MDNPRKQSSRRPNFLVVVVDDMGYSDLQPYGGEIRTPVAQGLADRGVRFRRFHTSSLCAPTRAMLLTGCDNHQVGLGVMQPLHSVNQYMQPGYEGYLVPTVPTVAELLRDAGYHTFMAGKWHVGITDETRPAARGFDRSFAFLGGGASHFHDARPLSSQEALQTLYVDEDRDVTRTLPDDFFSSTAYVDRMIDYVDAAPDDRPFFGYLAFTAPHDPLQVPDDWFDRYRGAYDGGYDAIRGPRLQRMKELGLIDDDLEANPGSGLFPTWEELDDDERAAEARKMEVYAAMVEHLDTELGRLLTHLDGRGLLDDTVVMFLSDNGANPKQPDFYAPNTPEQIARDFDNSLDNMGRIGSFVSMGGAWAEVANTPLSYFKTTTYEGGTQTPLIVAGGPVTRRGVVTDQLLHVCDLAPTLLDWAGAARPDTWGGQQTPELYGRSLVPVLEDVENASVRGEDDAVCFEMAECRSVLSGRWKLLWTAPPYGEGTRWQLFDLATDPRELNDLSAQLPEKVAEMAQHWEEYAARVGYVASDGSSAVAELGGIDRFFEFRLPED